jgi:hypothetical protein
LLEYQEQLYHNANAISKAQADRLLQAQHKQLEQATQATLVEPIVTKISKPIKTPKRPSFAKV